MSFWLHLSSYIGARVSYYTGVGALVGFYVQECSIKEDETQVRIDFF